MATMLNLTANGMQTAEVALSRRRALGEQACYWTAIIAPIALHLLISLILWDALGADYRTGAVESAIAWGKFLWLIPLPWALANLFGLVWFGMPCDRVPNDSWRWDMDRVLLVIAYVSRGENQLALRRATRETQRVLDRFRVPYVLEIVTDKFLPAESRVEETEGPIHYYVVPPDYATSSGARHKARALQYLLEQRTTAGNHDPDGRCGRNVWILHLDEESVVAPELVFGLREFLDRQHLDVGRCAIGQGEILYNSYRYASNPLIAAIDAVRTGDDLGRFRLQFKLWRRPIFGMHGSFVLVPAFLEERLTWDVGGLGSVTEDAYFSLRAMEKGVPFEWVEGFIREQSPFSLGDVVQQRRRWLCGLQGVARDPSFRYRTTLGLRIFVALWKLSWLGTLMVLVSVIAGLLQRWSFVSRELLVVCAFTTGIAGSTYIVGALRNACHSGLPRYRQLGILLVTYLLWLFFVPAIVEGWAVVFALLRPTAHFHVVRKNPIDNAAPAGQGCGGSSKARSIGSTHAPRCRS